MRLKSHIATSVALSGILYYIFKSTPMALAAFLSGIFIDLDHVLECYINFGRKFNIWHTMRACEAYELKKGHLFLHSYELVLIYSILVLLLDLGSVWYGIAVGLAFHVILDAVFNQYHPNGLFLLVRYKRKFEYHRIVDVPASQAKKKQQHKRNNVIHRIT